MGKGTKITEAPFAERRVEVRIRSNDPVAFYIPSFDETKEYESLEEVYTAVWKAHGIAVQQDDMTESDLLDIQRRTDIEITQAVSGVGDLSVYKLPVPMPCSEPFVCSMNNFRSRELKFNIVRRKCAAAEFAPDKSVRCARFFPLVEEYAGTAGSTTFDQNPRSASDDVILYVAMIMGSILAFLVATIVFMRLKTSVRLKKAY